MNNKWVINRAGFHNFWKYAGSFFFDFADGKLFLRGSNGRGKSVAMVSLLPPLLDGRVDARRMDPFFQSTDRKMGDILLEEQDILGIDSRIGYITLEYKRMNENGIEEYFTSGIGMKADRSNSNGSSSNLTRWYFAINGSPRVTEPNTDGFHVVEDNGDDTFSSLTKQVLKNKINGIGARFFDTPSSYGEYINKKIFQFTKIEEFNTMIKLLITLRASKLGDKSGPSSVTEILEHSMAELPEGELDILKNVIEDMERIQEDQVNLTNELKSLSKVNRKYRDYLDEKLGQLATAWLRNKQEYEIFIHSIDSTKEGIAKLDAKFHNLEEKQNLSERSLSLLREEYERNTIASDNELIRRVSELEKELEQLNSDIEKKNSQLKKHENYLKKLQSRLEDAKKDLEGQTEQQKQNFIDLLDNTSGFNYTKQHQKFLESLSSEDEKVIADIRRQKKLITDLQNNLSLIESCFKSINHSKSIVKKAEINHSKAIEELQIAKIQFTEATESLEEEKDRLYTEVVEWSNLTTFKIPSDYLNKSLSAIRKLYDNDTEFSDVMVPLEQAKRESINLLEQQLIPLQSQVEILQESLNQKKLEQDLLLKGKIVEPSRTEEHRHARETLKKSDIVFRSFYETVDFRENIEEDLKNTIESAVAESGFLDAIISTDANALIENDKLIIPQPFTLGERSNTLSHYLKIEKNLPDELSEIVGDILNSIQINEGDDPSLPIIYPDGTYQLSILKGKSNSQYKAAFIGESSREAERKRKLESLKNELSQLKEHQKTCKEEITQLEQKRSLYEEDFEACPNDLKVRESLRLHKRAMDQVAVKSELERMQLDQKEIAAAELQKHRKKLFDLRSLINIDVSEETLTEIKQYSNNYYNILEDIVETIHQLRKLKNRSAEQETDYHYQKELCKDAIEDLGIVTHQLEDKTTTLKKIKEQREFKEVEEMSLRQEKLKKEIRNKEEEKGATDRLLGELESKINNSREKLDLLIKQKEGKLQLKEDWLKLYSSAIQKYSLDAKIDLHSFSKQFGRKIDRNKLMQISAALTKVIRENRDQLLVYNLESELRKVTIRSKNEDDLLEVLYENWDDYNNFESVEVDTQNMRNSPFLLEAMLRKEKEENDQAYQKDQEEMYRQVLFGKLGKTTRELVVEGRNWAVKMDKMLQRVYGEKDDLQLELKLVPKPSQAEGVTSTSQLIDIWSNAEEGILREQDQKKVISFFKKGLDDAIVIVKENPGTTDLKEELKRVFDYRQWFFFRLNYKKNAKQKEFKRLTQEAFMKMSGGERAKSLYLPLFIAMRLRFESASENAPYIITLDEAFSGVDEEGRESMMGVAEELEFNYIMNSQEMWPEYPTVSSINTYEFKQGKSDPFVETVKYGWNGRVRSKIVGDEFE
ncbi:TIGR02680 family protein [Enterococcus durans]|uniref:TIGR02680 family protein n=1 Tax=Enterococcus durans TaxID=53345 RepID=UPI0039A5FDF7